MEGLCHKFVHNVYHNVRYMDEEETMKCIIPCTPLAVVKVICTIAVFVIQSSDSYVDSRIYWCIQLCFALWQSLVWSYHYSHQSQ